MDMMNDSVIDSREVIERIEELETEQAELMGDWDKASELDAPAEFLEWEKEYGEELDALRALADECEGYASDWTYGESLIARDYFVEYIEELINDCYEMPKAMNSGEWPYRHMTMDYEAAAEEAEQDYTTVEYRGREFLIRSC